jgi:hypothetical protein
MPRVTTKALASLAALPLSFATVHAAHADEVLARAGAWESVLTQGGQEIHPGRICRPAVTRATVIQRMMGRMGLCPNLQPKLQGSTISVDGQCSTTMGGKLTKIDMHVLIKVTDDSHSTTELHATYSPPPVAGMTSLDMKIAQRYVGPCAPGDTPEP